MAETTADVRRDIELTRERMTSTLSELENRLHVTRIVKDNPWPAVGLAFGAGLLLSGSRADVKAAGATALATRGATSRLAPALDDIVSNLMSGLGAALQGHVDTLIDEIKEAIGAPKGSSTGAQRAGFADMGTGASATAHMSGSQGVGASGIQHRDHATGGHTADAAAGQGSGSWAPHSAGLGDASGSSLTPSSAGSQASLG